MEPVVIRTGTIRLGSFLKLAGAVGTGGEAGFRIRAGEVSVNGAVVRERGKKLRSHDVVRLGEREFGVIAE